jgi:hypothetical protein
LVGGKEPHGESSLSNRWAIRAWLFAIFCFFLQLALVDNVGGLHPLVLGNIEQLFGGGCNFSSFSFGSPNS